MYLLSLARTEEVVQEHAVTTEDCGILWKIRAVRQSACLRQEITGGFSWILETFA